MQQHFNNARIYFYQVASIENSDNSSLPGITILYIVLQCHYK